MRLTDKQFDFFKQALNVLDNFGFCRSIDYIMSQVKQKKYTGEDGQAVLEEIWKASAYDA